MRHRANVGTLERLKLLWIYEEEKPVKHMEENAPESGYRFGSDQRGQDLGHFAVSCLCFQENSHK